MSGFIYSIGDGSGLVKIGWSVDPIKRLAFLKTSSPLDLKLVGIIPGTREQEREIHTLLRPWRVRREWFRYAGAVAEFVKRMQPPVRVLRAESIHPLARWRQANNLTQQQLADQIGVDRLSIWRWENGKRFPRKAMLARISSLTALTLVELLGDAA